MQLLVLAYKGVEFVLVKPPCFAEQAGDAVAVYGKAEFLFWH